MLVFGTLRRRRPLPSGSLLPPRTVRGIELPVLFRTTYKELSDRLQVLTVSSLSRVNPNMDRTRQMAALFENGTTLEAIGAEFGISRQRVHQILNAAGYSREDGGQTAACETRRAERIAEQDRRYREKYGFSFAEIRTFQRREITRTFRKQKASAKQRRIEWCLTFAEWWNAWQQSGYWDKRGAGRDRYCMARRGDAGPYSIENVYFCTNEKNVKDGFIFKPASSRQRATQVEDQAKKLIETSRRHHVEVLHRHGLSVRDIQRALAEPDIGCVNRDTGRPWGIATIHNDLVALSKK